MTKREASESLATALSEWRDAGGPVEAVVVAIRQLEESTQDDPPEPEIKPGELVYAWDGERPERPIISAFVRRTDSGKYRVAHSTIPDDEGTFDHVERFYMPFDWERWPSVEWVVDFDDSTRVVYHCENCPWDLDGHEKDGNGAHVVRILKRPEGR